MTIVRILSILCIGSLLSGQSSEGDLDSAFDTDILVISASEHSAKYALSNDKTCEFQHDFFLRRSLRSPRSLRYE